MSRCFPFPPPGYTLSSAKKEIMNELIKLHKGKQEKKEKRREKKERRKERRERRKNKKDKTNPNSDKSDIVKGQVCSDFRDEFSEKRREAKNVKFELSSLTEEHGRPNILPVPTSSCDSTENTRNRKKWDSPEDDSHAHSEAILMRFPSLMERPVMCNIEGINLGNNGEEICSTSGQTDVGKTTRSMSDDAMNPMQGVELRYEDLLQYWLPRGPQDTSLYTVDSDWLFQDRRNQEKQDEKRRRCGSDNVAGCRSTGWWPRAEYLPEVGAFALPYVVPY